MTVTNYEPFLNIKVCWRRGQLDPGAFDQTTIRYVRYRMYDRYGRYTLGGMVLPARGHVLRGWGGMVAAPDP